MRTSGTAHRSPVLRRVVFTLAIAVSVIAMQPTMGTAQTPGRTVQARICSTLQTLQARFGDVPAIRQVLLTYFARLGCTPGQPTTTVPATTTIVIGTSTTVAPPTTTTLPGGSTIPTSSTTLPPCPTTTTSLVPPTFLPTTIPCQP